MVTNGGWFSSTGAFTVGLFGHSNESVVVNGGGLASAASTILSNNGLMTIGAGGAGYDLLTVVNGSVWSSGLTLGSGSSNNSVNVLANGNLNLM